MDLSKRFFWELIIGYFFQISIRVWTIVLSVNQTTEKLFVAFQLSFYDIYYELCPDLEDGDATSNNSKEFSSKDDENGRKGTLV